MPTSPLRNNIIKICDQGGNTKTDELKSRLATIIWLQLKTVIAISVSKSSMMSHLPIQLLGSLEYPHSKIAKILIQENL